MRINISTSENKMIFKPQNIESDTGLIFYPGGKVEYLAYAPLMRKIAEEGYICVLVKMPFNLAVFDINSAAGVISEHEEIENWYIAGHSLGGAMASKYVMNNHDKIDGLVLLGAYPPSDLSNLNIKVMSIYGSEDKIMDIDNFQRGREYMPENYTELLISGGNHAQFGNYGVQDGDGIANISSTEQQELTAQNIINFMNNK